MAKQKQQQQNKNENTLLFITNASIEKLPFRSLELNKQNKSKNNK